MGPTVFHSPNKRELVKGRVIYDFDAPRMAIRRSQRSCLQMVSGSTRRLGSPATPRGSLQIPPEAFRLANEKLKSLFAKVKHITLHDLLDEAHWIRHGLEKRKGHGTPNSLIQLMAAPPFCVKCPESRATCSESPK